MPTQQIKFHCDRCNDFVPVYISDAIPTTDKIEIMFSIFCTEHHFIVRVNDLVRDLLEDFE